MSDIFKHKAITVHRLMYVNVIILLFVFVHNVFSVLAI